MSNTLGEVLYNFAHPEKLEVKALSFRKIFQKNFELTYKQMIRQLNLH